MAIDTRNKRASILNIEKSGRIFPNPDGSLANVLDRQQVGMVYAGISSGASPTGSKIPWHLFFRGSI
jgi:hypothetical protein